MAGLAYGANLAGMPPQWIAVCAVVLAGIGIVMGVIEDPHERSVARLRIVAIESLTTRLTRAERLSVVVPSGARVVVTAGYAIDAAGLGAGAAARWRWPRRRRRGNPRDGRSAYRRRARHADLLVWMAVVLHSSRRDCSGWRGRRWCHPAAVRTSRITCLLVDYIEQQGHLVHDRSLDGSMGEMAHYTPGAHLLAVFVGAMDRQSMACGRSFRCWSCATALTAGFVFLIARRLPPADSVRDRARSIAAVPALTVFLRCLHARRVPRADGGHVLRGGVRGGRSSSWDEQRDRRSAR